MYYMSKIIITAVGDISLSRDIKQYITQCKKNNYEKIFKYVRKYIENSDISIGNLESVISDNTNSNLYKKGGPSFRASNKSIEALNNSGLTTLNIANNHSNDYGSIGILDTINILSEYNYNIVGKKDIPYEIYNINNYKIIVIGICSKFKRLENNKYVYVYNSKTAELISKLKEQCNLLIVTIHWGTEYKLSNNSYQKEIGHILVKSGADIILGHHPHVMQNMERVKLKKRTGFIFYSLGNFVFDSHYKKSGVRNTFIVKIIINPNNNNVKFEYLPCIIYPKLGFIPKPIKKTFQNNFPKKHTIYADNLYKNVFTYLSNCIQKGGNINKSNICKYVIFVFLVICIFNYLY